MDERLECDYVALFQESFCSKYFLDISIDIIDKRIESLVVDGLLSEVPILKALSRLYQAGKDIQKGRLLKKTMVFLFETKDILPDERRRFVEEYTETSKDLGSELMLVALDRFDNVNKVKYYSNLLRAKIDKFISIEDFIRVENALEKVPITDLIQLDKYINDNYCPGESESLYSVGLVFQSVINVGHTSKYRLTKTGYQMLMFVLKVGGYDFPTDYKISIPGFITAVDTGESVMIPKDVYDSM